MTIHSMEAQARAEVERFARGTESQVAVEALTKV